jgi:hypothetical protein
MLSNTFIGENHSPTTKSTIPSTVLFDICKIFVCVSEFELWIKLLTIKAVNVTYISSFSLDCNLRVNF